MFALDVILVSPYKRILINFFSVRDTNMAAMAFVISVPRDRVKTLHIIYIPTKRTWMRLNTRYLKAICVELIYLKLEQWRDSRKLNQSYQLGLVCASIIKM